MHFETLFEQALRRWMDQQESPPRWLGSVQEMSRVYHDRMIQSGIPIHELEDSIFALLSFYS